jgi:cell division protein FtsB
VARKSAVKTVQAGAGELLRETQEAIGRLLRENRALKARNLKLDAELKRVSDGWDTINQLARAAPRRRR